MLGSQVGWLWSLSALTRPGVVFTKTTFQSLPARIMLYFTGKHTVTALPEATVIRESEDRNWFIIYQGTFVPAVYTLNMPFFSVYESNNSVSPMDCLFCVYLCVCNLCVKGQFLPTTLFPIKKTKELLSMFVFYSYWKLPKLPKIIPKWWDVTWAK